MERADLYSASQPGVCPDRRTGYGRRANDQFDNTPTTRLEASVNRLSEMVASLGVRIAKVENLADTTAKNAVLDNSPPSQPVPPPHPYLAPDEVAKRLADAYGVPSFETITNIELPNGAIRWYIGQPLRAVQLIRDYNLDGNLFAEGDYLVEFTAADDSKVWLHMFRDHFQKQFTKFHGVPAAEQWGRVRGILSRIFPGFTLNDIEQAMMQNKVVVFDPATEECSIRFKG